MCKSQTITKYMPFSCNCFNLKRSRVNLSVLNEIFEFCLYTSRYIIENMFFPYEIWLRLHFKCRAREE